MSDLIINFGSQIVPCSKLAENFYFGSIKFKDILTSILSVKLRFLTIAINYLNVLKMVL
jgi:hypothetical protein